MVSVAYERFSFHDSTGENFSVLIGGSVWEVVAHESFFPALLQVLVP